jgi:hypothetical protein
MAQRSAHHSARTLSVRRRLFALLLIATCGGCASLGKPEWLEPGPARNQQRRAVRFDPFMETENRHDQLSIMDGSRPRDYAQPVPEVKRARWWSQPLQ